jgi:hypothetical protein
MSGLTMVCLDNKTLHMLAYIAMDQLCKTFFSMKEIMGLDIQTNTLIFQIEFVRLTKHKIWGLVIWNSG